MGNKVFTAVVLLLWGSSMTWLVAAKIAPRLLRGEPPLVGRHDREPVCWRVLVDGQPLGVAASQMVDGASGTMEIHSRLRIEDVPFDRLAPRWMASLVTSLGDVDLDLRTRTTIDTLQHLSSFETHMTVNDLPTAVRINGRPRGDRLQLEVLVGNTVKKFSYPWNSEQLLGSELTPDTKLIGAYVGRKWRQDVYSPLGGSRSALDSVEAEVMREEPFFVGGRLQTVRLVEYRSMESEGVSRSDRVRGKLWVAEDGTVLRQEAVLANVTVRFERLSERETEEVAEDFLQLAEFATVTTPKSQRAAVRE